MTEPMQITLDGDEVPHGEVVTQNVIAKANDLAREGFTEKQIAVELDVDLVTVQRWIGEVR